MAKKKLLAGYNFVIVPNLSNKLALFRKELFKKNGATISYNLNHMDEELKNFIIIEDTGPTIDKSNFARKLNLKNFNSDDLLVVKYPVLKKEWVTDSLTENKIQDFAKYGFPVEGVRSDSKLEEPYIVESDSKKRKAPEAKEQQTQKKKFKAEGTPNDSISEDEHATSKQIMSSKRQLAFLNSEALNSENPNQLIIEYFSQMAAEYKSNGESFKYVNYRKAIDTISRLDHKLESYEEAIKLPNIGKRLALKVQQINETGELKQLDELKADPKLRTLQNFRLIYGVGQTTALQWYDQGLRTIEEVSKLPSLSGNQKLGIKYYKDWNTKIPREEVDKHISYIKSVLLQIDVKAELMCTGSYRRGKQELGDIDFLVMKRDCNDRTELGELLSKLVHAMIDDGYIKCALMQVYSQMKKFYGGGQLPGYEYCRRVDFLAVPWQRRGATLIYFTGNDILNRSIRQLASDKGLHLNEKGLFRNYNTDKQELIESFDERLIFQKLGVDYRDPKDRNLGSFQELSSNQ